MTERLKTLLTLFSLMIIWFIENNWDKIIQAIQWSWSQMTLLSGLIIIMILAIAGLSCLALEDRKKCISRAYWRGRRFKNENKKIEK